jgi:hypothetical protein
VDSTPGAVYHGAIDESSVTGCHEAIGPFAANLATHRTLQLSACRAAATPGSLPLPGLPTGTVGMVMARAACAVNVTTKAKIERTMQYFIVVFPYK